MLAVMNIAMNIVSIGRALCVANALAFGCAQHECVSSALHKRDTPTLTDRRSAKGDIRLQQAQDAHTY